MPSQVPNSQLDPSPPTTLRTGPAASTRGHIPFVTNNLVSVAAPETHIEAHDNSGQQTNLGHHNSLLMSTPNVEDRRQGRRGSSVNLVPIADIDDDDDDKALTLGDFLHGSRNVRSRNG